VEVNSANQTTSAMEEDAYMAPVSATLVRSKTHKNSSRLSKPSSKMLDQMPQLKSEDSLPTLQTINLSATPMT